MEVATIRVRLNKVGSDVPVTNATPAEAVLLHVLHQSNNGGSTFGEDMDKIKVTGKAQKMGTIAAVGEVGKPGYIPAKEGLVDVTDREEYNRLFHKYGRIMTKRLEPVIEKVFDPRNPQLPKTFAEIKWSEVQFDGNSIAANSLATGAPVNPLLGK